MKPLSSSVRKGDVKVEVGRWRPTREGDFPPVAAVLAANLWRLPCYHEVRERLKRPAPVVSVHSGGAFKTLSISGSGDSLAMGDRMDEEDEAGGPAEVCLVDSAMSALGSGFLNVLSVP